MAFVRILKQLLHQRQLERHDSSNLHNLKTDHFKQIQSIGIVFFARDRSVRETVLDYKENLILAHKKVKLLGYFDTKLSNAMFPFDYFTRGDINFAYIPKGTVVSHFIDEPFDVLINLDLSGKKPLEYVVAASKAFFKIGPMHNKIQLYDMMIETSPSTSTESLISEIRQTFNRIQ